MSTGAARMVKRDLALAVSNAGPAVVRLDASVGVLTCFGGLEGLHPNLPRHRPFGLLTDAWT